ncbi:Lachesin [Nymphon striatum]|nr:Lachesin [Nymphon striatum]
MSDAVALEGTDITLSCSASGYPEPTIKWRREDGRDISIADPDIDIKRVQIVLSVSVDEVEGANLEIKRVSRLDMGAFLCMASNGVAPSVSHRVLLQVNFPPMLWIPNQLIGVGIGDSTTLECNGEAYPKSISYWTNKTGDIIMSDDHYSTTMTEVNSFKTHMMLKILKVRKQDYGVYKCISKNPLGVTEGQLTLYRKFNFNNLTSNQPRLMNIRCLKGIKSKF